MTTPGLDALPTEMRLRALEARVRGVPPTSLGDHEAPSGGGTLTQRAAMLRAKLDDAGNKSPPIKQFVNDYNRYAPLLRMLPTDEEFNTTANDYLAPEAKAALVLESRGDIVAAEKGLREIQVYASRDVAGAGDLPDIVQLKPALKAGTERVAARHKNLEENRADVAALVERYTDFTSTVSDMFLALHDQLTNLEEAVTRAERAKRDELKFRF